MEKFTQGEWVVDKEVKHLPNHIEYTVSAPYALVCKCVGTTNPMLDWYAGACHVKANAHLIRAAPDMYRALREVTEWLAEIYGNQEEAEMFERCNAALAKADGEPK